MLRCSKCENWAQWRMFRVERVKLAAGKEFTLIEGRLRPVAKPGPFFIPIPAGEFCTLHKLEAEKKPAEPEHTFKFIGAEAVKA
jgi:hypothetical protein